MGGIGGCPMTGYELLSNLDTMYLIQYLEDEDISHGLEMQAIHQASKYALKLKTND